MIKRFRKLERVLLAAALAGVAALGAVSGTPAKADTFAQHGLWTSFVDKLDGHIATGAVTRLDDGSLVAVLITQNRVMLRLSGRGWELRTGTSTPIRIRVDGTVYRGSGEAVNDSEYQVADLPADFIEALMQGRRALVEINGSVWNLNLQGIKPSLKDAAQLYVETAS